MQYIIDIIGQPLPKFEVVLIGGVEVLADRGYDLQYIAAASLLCIFSIGLFKILLTFQNALSNRRSRK